MATAHTEVERKLDVDPGFAVPPLDGLPGVAGLRAVEHHLSATYFDTRDGRLLRHRITLRRRTGGADPGWHLKLPPLPGDPAGARTEIQVPLGRAGADPQPGADPEPGTDDLPSELIQLVRARARRARLRPVVRLTTVRRVTELLDDAGQVLAEVCDDEVEAQRAGSTAHWRELEVELAAGDPALLTATVDALLEAGARPAAVVSKLARAVGAATEPPAAPAEPRTAGEVVGRYLAEQVEQLQAWDPHVRLDGADAVHKMRVATRRLRSALATYRPLLDRAVTDPLREELAWLAAQLGAARDAEVIRDRLLASARSLPSAAQAAELLERQLGERYRAAHDSAVASLESARYLRLLDRLDALAADPPLTELAAKGRKRVRKLVRRAARRVDRAKTALDDAPAADPGLRGTRLHDLRKAAKRARYAAESAAPVLSDATTSAESYERLQEALGEVQDAVTARATLLELANGEAHRAAGDPVNPAFTLGVLAGLEWAAQQRAEAQFEAAWPPWRC